MMTFVQRAAIALLIVAPVACKPKSSSPSPDASTSSAAAPAPTPMPVPAEPPPPLANKADEVPTLEAKLTKDAAYTKTWAATESPDRLLMMTAISDFLAHGTLHSDVETAVKKAKLSDAVSVVQKVLWRNGKLPADFAKKVEDYLATNKTAARHGLWNPDAKDAVPLDATALSMWMHPDDPAYVRERMHALVRGPFRPAKDIPVKRVWLVNLGDVINRLNGLGAFTKEDCLGVGAKWAEKLGADGRTFSACDPPDEVKPPPPSDEEAKLRKACNVAPSEKLQVADDAEVKVMCQSAVERNLKSPKSAEFPGVFDEDAKPRSIDGCTTVYASWVDAQNSFGANLRTRYVCTYDPRTGVASAVFAK